MRAIAFTRPLPIEAPDSLVELDLPRPEPGPRDLLVNVRAVSVNPVDTKIRGARHQGSVPDGTGKPRVAAGVVVDKGGAVTGFAVDAWCDGCNTGLGRCAGTLARAPIPGYRKSASQPESSPRVPLTTVPSMLTRLSGAVLPK
jgi:NADPH:quinone reductase-like Zn-dependent oxidoreductase